MADQNDEIAALPNLGPASSVMLRQAGIDSRQKLEALGPVAAYRAVIDAGSAPSLNLLWAIAGALSDTHWTRLADDYRSSLLLEYDAACDLAGRYE